MNNTTIQEICDAVKGEMVEHIHKEILEIKSELLIEVVAKVTEILNKQYAPIVSELEKKINNLETEICYIDRNNKDHDY